MASLKEIINDIHIFSNINHYIIIQTDNWLNKIVASVDFFSLSFTVQI